MKLSDKIVGVDIDGRVEWHLIGGGGPDYDTACGLDADDPSIGHNGTVSPPRGQRVDCMECRTLWEHWRDLRVRESDFE